MTAINTNNKEKTNEQAALIIQKIQTAVKRRFPFLTPVISSIEFKRVDTCLNTFETDRINIYYNAENVLRHYSTRNLASLEKKYMHIILHGLLGHFEMRDDYLDTPLIDAAMDLKVNGILNEMYDINSFNTNIFYRSFSEDSITDELKSLSLTEIYYKCDSSKSKYQRLMEYCETKKVDDHNLWKVRLKFSNKSDGCPCSDAERSEQKKYEYVKDLWKKCREKSFGHDLDKNIIGNRLCEMLKNNRPASWSDEGGFDEQKCSAYENSENDYKNVIQSLLKQRVSDKPNENDFDKMIYTYGFDLYGNLALLEPEEESSSGLSLDTLIIAVDTSGSCSGYIMRRFLTELRQLLLSLSETASFKRIILMQCDCRILKEESYESADDFPTELINNMQMKMYGFGGTSFIPVFDRVDEIIKQDNCEVEGVIYFSDAFGNYPAWKPEYDTIFVIPSNDGAMCNSDIYENIVPKWVKKSYIKI